MSNQQTMDEVLEGAEPGRRAAVRKILVGTMICAAPIVTSLSLGSLGGMAQAQPSRRGDSRPAVQSNLYAILDIGAVGSITHHVVSIDISTPGNISYVPIGTIAGFADKYVVSATSDLISGKIFFAMSNSDSNTSADNIYLYSVTFPDLLTIAPFCTSNAVYVNLNPQAAYHHASGLFYYAMNDDPKGFGYKINTIDSSGNIAITSINVLSFLDSNNGLQIFNDHVYAPHRPGSSFVVGYAGINNNVSGSISTAVTPMPPGQIWSIFDSSGVMWGVTQYGASSPPSYSLYRLQCTTAGLPASSPFPSELVGIMPAELGGNVIANMTLFATVPSDPIFADGFE